MSRRKDIPCACGESATKNKSIKKINNVAGDPNGDFEIIAGNGLSIYQSGDNQVTIGGRPVTQYDDGLMTSEDKIKLENVQNTYATKEELGNVQLSVNDKVSKRGDTMTGPLKLTKETTVQYQNTSNVGFPDKYKDRGSFLFKDSNGGLLGLLGCDASADYIRTIVMAEAIIDSTSKTAKIEARINPDASVCGMAPSWSVGTNDNSDKILTIKMANSLPSLVHTTGNETISGAKTFTSRIVEQKSSDMGMEMLSTTFDRGAAFTSYQRPVQFIARDKNGDSVLLLQTYAESNNRRGLDLMLYDMNGDHCELSLKSDGSKRYASAPATPTNASGNEIATAGWVKNLINQFAAANGLNGI